MTPEERFWSHVDIGGPDECWLWTASLDRYGYGEICWRWPTGRGGWKMLGAHRVALALAGDGTFPRGRRRGLDAAHSCDNPPCVNPSHLRWMTTEENNYEKKLRNVAPVGTRHRATVTPEMARTMRERAATGEANTPIALDFGVHRSTVAQIVGGHTHRETFDPALHEAALANRVERDLG